MKGIVNIALNERRLSPSVNAHTSVFYKKGDVVEIVESVIGDFYDGDNLWYKLNNGSFIWAGGVDVEFDGLPIREEDRNQFLISYREVKGSRPDMDSSESARSLYFAPIRFPVADDTVQVNELKPNLFASGVIDSIRGDVREHVIVYVHGYQLFSSLKLDLFLHFVQNYTNHERPSIAKVIFLTWPAFGLSRKTKDDDAIRLGEDFTSRNFFETFRILSDRLREHGKKLSLFVHSFGNILLNGMINPPPFRSSLPGDQTSKIFENIFLMAPDITHLSACGEGINLPNIFQSKKGRDKINYALRNLTGLASHVHVFYDKYDFLLHVSTRISLGRKNVKHDKPDDEIVPKEFRILGNYGRTEFSPENEVLNFNFVDVDKLVNDAKDFGNMLYFPFRKMTKHSVEIIDHAVKNVDYKRTNGWRVLWQNKRFADHHRYLFTCKPVVDKVIELLNNPNAGQPDPSGNVV